MKLVLSLISKKGIVFNKESFFIPVDIELTEFKNSENEEEIRIKAVGYGEIIYSAMQII